MSLEILTKFLPEISTFLPLDDLLTFTSASKALASRRIELVMTCCELRNSYSLSRLVIGPSVHRILSDQLRSFDPPFILAESSLERIESVLDLIWNKLLSYYNTKGFPYYLERTLLLFYIALSGFHGPNSQPSEVVGHSGGYFEVIRDIPSDPLYTLGRNLLLPIGLTVDFVARFKDCCISGASNTLADVVSFWLHHVFTLTLPLNISLLDTDALSLFSAQIRSSEKPLILLTGLSAPSRFSSPLCNCDCELGLERASDCQCDECSADEVLPNLRSFASPSFLAAALNRSKLQSSVGPNFSTSLALTEEATWYGTIERGENVRKSLIPLDSETIERSEISTVISGTSSSATALSISPWNRLQQLYLRQVASCTGTLSLSTVLLAIDLVMSSAAPKLWSHLQSIRVNIPSMSWSMLYSQGSIPWSNGAPEVRRLLLRVNQNGWIESILMVCALWLFHGPSIILLENASDVHAHVRNFPSRSNITLNNLHSLLSSHRIRSDTISAALALASSTSTMSLPTNTTPVPWKSPARLYATLLLSVTSACVTEKSRFLNPNTTLVSKSQRAPLIPHTTGPGRLIFALRARMKPLETAMSSLFPLGLDYLPSVGPLIPILSSPPASLQLAAASARLPAPPDVPMVLLAPHRPLHYTSTTESGQKSSNNGVGKIAVPSILTQAQLPNASIGAASVAYVSYQEGRVPGQLPMYPSRVPLHVFECSSNPSPNALSSTSGGGASSLRGTFSIGSNCSVQLATSIREFYKTLSSTSGRSSVLTAAATDSLLVPSVERLLGLVPADDEEKEEEEVGEDSSASFSSHSEGVSGRVGGFFGNSNNSRGRPHLVDSVAAGEPEGVEQSASSEPEEISFVSPEMIELEAKASGSIDVLNSIAGSILRQVEAEAVSPDGKKSNLIVSEDKRKGNDVIASVLSKSPKSPQFRTISAAPAISTAKAVSRISKRFLAPVREKKKVQQQFPPLLAQNSPIPPLLAVVAAGTSAEQQTAVARALLSPQSSTALASSSIANKTPRSIKGAEPSSPLIRSPSARSLALSSSFTRGRSFSVEKLIAEVAPFESSSDHSKHSKPSKSISFIGVSEDDVEEVDDDSISTASRDSTREHAPSLLNSNPSFGLAPEILVKSIPAVAAAVVEASSLPVAASSSTKSAPQPGYEMEKEKQLLTDIYLNEVDMSSRRQLALFSLPGTKATPVSSSETSPRPHLEADNKKSLPEKKKERFSLFSRVATNRSKLPLDSKQDFDDSTAPAAPPTANNDVIAPNDLKNHSESVPELPGRCRAAALVQLLEAVVQEDEALLNDSEAVPVQKTPMNSSSPSSKEDLAIAKHAAELMKTFSRNPAHDDAQLNHHLVDLTVQQPVPDTTATPQYSLGAAFAPLSPPKVLNESEKTSNPLSELPQQGLCTNVLSVAPPEFFPPALMEDPASEKDPAPAVPSFLDRLDDLDNEDCVKVLVEREAAMSTPIDLDSRRSTFYDRFFRASSTVLGPFSPPSTQELLLATQRRLEEEKRASVDKGDICQLIPGYLDNLPLPADLLSEAMEELCVSKVEEKVASVEKDVSVKSVEIVDSSVLIKDSLPLPQVSVGEPALPSTLSIAPPAASVVATPLNNVSIPSAVIPESRQNQPVTPAATTRSNSVTRLGAIVGNMRDEVASIVAGSSPSHDRVFSPEFDQMDAQQTISTIRFMLSNAKTDIVDLLNYLSPSRGGHSSSEDFINRPDNGAAESPSTLNEMSPPVSDRDQFDFTAHYSIIPEPLTAPKRVPPRRPRGERPIGKFTPSNLIQSENSTSLSPAPASTDSIYLSKPTSSPEIPSTVHTPPRQATQEYLSQKTPTSPTANSRKGSSSDLQILQIPEPPELLSQLPPTPRRPEHIAFSLVEGGPIQSLRSLSPAPVESSQEVSASVDVTSTIEVAVVLPMTETVLEDSSSASQEVLEDVVTPSINPELIDVSIQEHNEVQEIVLPDSVEIDDIIEKEDVSQELHSAPIETPSVADPEVNIDNISMEEGVHYVDFTAADFGVLLDDGNSTPAFITASADSDPAEAEGLNAVSALSNDNSAEETVEFVGTNSEEQMEDNSVEILEHTISADINNPGDSNDSIISSNLLPVKEAIEQAEQRISSAASSRQTSPATSRRNSLNLSQLSGLLASAAAVDASVSPADPLNPQESVISRRSSSASGSKPTFVVGRKPSSKPSTPSLTPSLTPEPPQTAVQSLVLSTSAETISEVEHSPSVVPVVERKSSTPSVVVSSTKPTIPVAPRPPTPSTTSPTIVASVKPTIPSISKPTLPAISSVPAVSSPVRSTTPIPNPNAGSTPTNSVPVSRAASPVVPVARASAASVQPPPKKPTTPSVPASTTKSPVIAEQRPPLRIVRPVTPAVSHSNDSTVASSVSLTPAAATAVAVAPKRSFVSVDSFSTSSSTSTTTPAAHVPVLPPSRAQTPSVSSNTPTVKPGVTPPPRTSSPAQTIKAPPKVVPPPKK